MSSHPNTAPSDDADMTLTVSTGEIGEAGRGPRCSDCAARHGERGDGAGSRVYLDGPKLPNFLDVRARATLSRRRNLRGLDEWRGGYGNVGRDSVLAGQQIADVAEHVVRAAWRPTNI